MLSTVESRDEQFGKDIFAHRSHLLKYLKGKVRLTAAYYDLEEIVDATIEKAWTYRQAFFDNKKNQLESWLFTIAKNRLVDVQRRMKYRKTYQHDFSQQKNGEDNTFSSIDKEVLSATSCLDEQDTYIFATEIHKYIETRGLPQKNALALLINDDIISNVKTVTERNRIQRLRNELRDEFEITEVQTKRLVSSEAKPRKSRIAKVFADPKLSQPTPIPEPLLAPAKMYPEEGTNGYFKRWEKSMKRQLAKLEATNAVYNSY